MQSKKFLPLIFLLAILFVQSEASGQPFPHRRANALPPQIHLLPIYYGGGDKFPSLAQKTGVTMAIAPFEDTRRERRYIGQQTTQGQVSAYFRSEPFPLEKSIQEFFIAALNNSSIDPILTSAWNGKRKGPTSLKNDSILKVRINRFWIKADTERGGRRTRIYTWVYLDLLLGLKKQDNVLSQSVYVGEESLYGPEFSPQILTDSLNQTLRNVVDAYLGSL